MVKELSGGDPEEGGASGRGRKNPPGRVVSAPGPEDYRKNIRREGESVGKLDGAPDRLGGRRFDRLTRQHGVQGIGQFEHWRHYDGPGLKDGRTR